MDDNGTIVNFPAANSNSASFKFKEKITYRIGDNGTKNVEIMVLLIYKQLLENSWNVYN